jgi:hypothetical protein
MKTKKFIYTGLAALALASSSAFGQTVYEHPVTLTLKGSVQGPEEYKESENSNKFTYSYNSKFLVGKFSNKEFLEALVDAEVISDIKGWSLKFVVDSDGDEYGLFIVKKNSSPIDVSSYAGFDTEDIVEEYSSKYTEFSNGDDEASGSWTERGVAQVFIDVPGLTILLNGSYVLSGDWKESYDWESDEETSSEKLKSGSFDDLVGVIGGELESRDVVLGDETAIVGGYVTLGGGKAIQFLAD